MEKNSNLVVGGDACDTQSLFCSWGGEPWPPGPGLGDLRWQFGEKGSEKGLRDNFGTWHRELTGE